MRRFLKIIKLRIFFLIFQIICTIITIIPMWIVWPKTNLGLPEFGLFAILIILFVYFISGVSAQWIHERGN